MSQEIAVVGAPEFTTGFRLAGVRTFENVREAEKSEALDDAVRRVLEDEEIGIIVMHQKDLQYLSGSMRETVAESIEPTFVTLGSSTAGGSGLREQIKRAIGIDLMAEEDTPHE